jgi:hypothetical protein
MMFHDTEPPTDVLHPVDLLMTTAQAMALARFVKRIGWAEFRANAVDDDEARDVQAAVDAVQKALAEAGFAMR